MGQHPQNPVIATEKPKDSTPRDRVLKDAELVAIWNACGDDDFGNIVRLLICTGCRRDEIGGLRWSEIDEESGTLRLPKERTKNKRKHELPLIPLALSIVGKAHKVVGRDHLFGDRSNKGFTRWDATRVALNEQLGDRVGEWRLHDIRRTVATRMGDLGVEPHIIEAVLNHYSGHRSGVAGTYNRARYERQIRAALALWSDHVAALIGGTDRKIISFPQTAHETA